MLFQVSGCFAVANSVLGDSVEWEEIRATLDSFISGGYREVTAGAFPKLHRGNAHGKDRPANVD